MLAAEIGGRWRPDCQHIMQRLVATRAPRAPCPPKSGSRAAPPGIAVQHAVAGSSRLCRSGRSLAWPPSSTGLPCGRPAGFRCVAQASHPHQTRLAPQKRRGGKTNQIDGYFSEGLKPTTRQGLLYCLCGTITMQTMRKISKDSSSKKPMVHGRSGPSHQCHLTLLLTL